MTSPFGLLDALRRLHHDTTPEQLKAHEEQEAAWNELRYGKNEEDDSLGLEQAAHVEDKLHVPAKQNRPK